MTVTFLLEVNLDTISDLIGTSEDIAHHLSSAYDVISVKPWSRPATAPLPKFSPQTKPKNNIT